jgi:hypothetical protein
MEGCILFQELQKLLALKGEGIYGLHLQRTKTLDALKSTCSLNYHYEQP